MKRSHQIILTGLTILSITLSAIILGILLFKQDAVPQFAVGPRGNDAIVNYASIYDYINKTIDGLPKSTNGKDAKVDYSAINDYINKRVASLPKPKNGKKALPCTTTPTETGAVIACPDGTSAIISNGVDGSDGKTPYLQCNETKNRWEIRYSPDENWQVLNGIPTPCKVVS